MQNMNEEIPAGLRWALVALAASLLCLIVAIALQAFSDHRAVVAAIQHGSITNFYYTFPVAPTNFYTRPLEGK
jgi:hypothetical protein